jgi:hypothetical protein
MSWLANATILSNRRGVRKSSRFIGFNGLAGTAPYFDGSDRIVRLQGGDFTVGQFSSWSGCAWIAPANYNKYIFSALYDIDPQGTISMWVSLDSLGRVVVDYADDANQLGKQIRSNTNGVQTDVWTLIAWSIDIEEGFDAIQINDEAGHDVVYNTTAGSVSFYPNRGVYGTGDFGNSNTSSKFVGGLYNVFTSFGTFENVTSDIGAFANIGTDYSPRNLGLNGTATGLPQPLILHNRPFDLFQVNGGTAGTPGTLSGTLTAVLPPTIPGSSL